MTEKLKRWAILSPMLAALIGTSGAIVSTLINSAGSDRVRSVASEVARQECINLIEQHEKTYLQGVHDGAQETIKELQDSQQPLGKLVILPRKRDK